MCPLSSLDNRMRALYLMATLLPSMTTGLKLLAWLRSTGAAGLCDGDTARGEPHPLATSCGLLLLLLLLGGLELLAEPPGSPLCAPVCLAAVGLGVAEVVAGALVLLLVLVLEAWWPPVLMSSPRMSLVWASWRRLSNTRTMSARE